MESIINNFINYFSSFGLMGCFFITYIESIIPIVPLCAFITINVLSFGSVIGFIISYISTILGCLTMYFICTKIGYKINNKKVNNLKDKISSISFSGLVILIAIPFTPAFAVNVAAGVSNISFKKYFYAILIGKLPMIYFWAFIGKTLVESITDITVIVKICVMIILSLLVSKIANKYLRI